MKKEIGFTVVRAVLKPDEAPQTAHWVGFSRIASEIVMDVGFVDMPETVNQIARGREAEQLGEPPDELPELRVKVLQRYGLGLDAFMMLKRNVRCYLRRHGQERSPANWGIRNGALEKCLACKKQQRRRSTTGEPG